jgi:hypothetical protein
VVVADAVVAGLAAGQSHGFGALAAFGQEEAVHIVPRLGLRRLAPE